MVSVVSQQLFLLLVHLTPSDGFTLSSTQNVPFFRSGPSVCDLSEGSGRHAGSPAVGFPVLLHVTLSGPGQPGKSDAF